MAQMSAPNASSFNLQLVDRHASHASMQQYLYEVHFKIAIAERSLQRYDRVDAQIKEMEKYGESEVSGRSFMLRCLSSSCHVLC